MTTVKYCKRFQLLPTRPPCPGLSSTSPSDHHCPRSPLRRVSDASLARFTAAVRGESTMLAVGCGAALADLRGEGLRKPTLAGAAEGADARGGRGLAPLFVIAAASFAAALLAASAAAFFSSSAAIAARYTACARASSSATAAAAAASAAFFFSSYAAIAARYTARARASSSAFAAFAAASSRAASRWIPPSRGDSGLGEAERRGAPPSGLA